MWNFLARPQMSGNVPGTSRNVLELSSCPPPHTQYAVRRHISPAEFYLQARSPQGSPSPNPNPKKPGFLKASVSDSEKFWKNRSVKNQGTQVVSAAARAGVACRGRGDGRAKERDSLHSRTNVRQCLASSVCAGATRRLQAGSGPDTPQIVLGQS